MRCVYKCNQLHLNDCHYGKWWFPATPAQCLFAKCVSYNMRVPISYSSIAVPGPLSDRMMWSMQNINSSNLPQLWKVEITRDPVISSCDREGYYASFGSLWVEALDIQKVSNVAIVNLRCGWIPNHGARINRSYACIGSRPSHSSFERMTWVSEKRCDVCLGSGHVPCSLSCFMLGSPHVPIWFRNSAW